MKHSPNKAFLGVLIITVAAFLSCAKDFQGDIDSLNTKYAEMDRRVGSLESQVSKMNQDLSTLSVLAKAVEQGFYIKDVKTTSSGYELTLNDGMTVELQSGPGNSLTQAPAVSMARIGEAHYWTLNGMLMTDDEGHPIAAQGSTPKVRYDKTSQTWQLSTDGGMTFVNVNLYGSVVINDAVLLQVLNNYIQQHSTTFVSEEVLYQIVSNYIEQHYTQIFDVDILNKVIVSYVEQHYTQVFSYEVLQSIFNQYNFQYATQHLDVDFVTNILMTFITEHKETFIDNEVIYAILNNYIEVNHVTIFNKELIVEVINNYISHNTNFISVELLQQIVSNYIEQHQEVIINNEFIQNILIEYVQKNYLQIFSQDIIVQLLNKYVVENKTTIFNKTLIEEVISVFIQNNYSTLISSTVLNEIITNYIELNKTTIINETMLFEVISNFFQKNYNIIVDEKFVSQIINSYIQENKTTIIDIDIVRQVVISYVRNYYTEIFDYDFLTTVISNYFEQNVYLIQQYVSQYTGVIRDVIVDGDICLVTLNNGTTVQLVVYDAYARVRDRVQSIVLVPNANGHITHYNNYDYVQLDYLVTPAWMARVIAQDTDGRIGVDIVVLDGQGNATRYKADKISFDSSGSGKMSLYLPWLKQHKETSKTLGLYVYDNSPGGTNYQTTFTPIEWIEN